MNLDPEILILKTSLLAKSCIEELLQHDVREMMTNYSSELYSTIMTWYFKYQQVPSFEIVEKEVTNKYTDSRTKTEILALVDQIKVIELPHGSTVPYLIDELKFEFRKRELTQSLTRSAAYLKQGKIEDSYFELQSLLHSDANNHKEANFVQSGNIVQEAEDDYRLYCELEGTSESEGVLTGIHELDSRLNGLKPGELGVISGRPGVGKSTLLLNLGFFPFYFFNKNVVYVSLEMPKDQLKRRFYSRGALVDYKDLKNRTLDQDSKAAWRKFLDSLQGRTNIFYILDIPFKTNAAYIETHLVRLLRGFDIDLLIIDYLGNMKSKEKTNSKWEDQGEACLESRELARKYKIPTWTATQLTRASTESEELDTDDIANSDMISQTADFILGIYPPKDSQETKRMMATFIKSRDSDKMKNFPLHYDGSKMLYSSLENNVEKDIGWL